MERRSESEVSKVRRFCELSARHPIVSRAPAYSSCWCYRRPHQRPLIDKSNGTLRNSPEFLPLWRADAGWFSGISAAALGRNAGAVLILTGPSEVAFCFVRFFSRRCANEDRADRLSSGLVGSPAHRTVLSQTSESVNDIIVPFSAAKSPLLGASSI